MSGLMIGVPTLNRPTLPEWGFAFKAITPPINFNTVFAIIRNQPVDVARNMIARAAIENNSKYIFFVGDDTAPPAHALRNMIFNMENNPKIGVIGGVYFSKSEPSFPLVFKENGSGAYWDWKVGEFFPVTGVGMDCTLIRTEVFRKLPEPWFKTVDTDSFLDGVNHAEMWTEDLFFLQRVRDFTEFEIWCDAGIIAEHYDAINGKIYSIPPGSLPTRRLKVQGNKNIIDIGCGPQYVEFEEGHAVRYDIDERWSPDYRGDARRLPFENASFDIVYSSHVLEHFERKEVDNIITEWVRILKPNGELRLVLPNILWAAERIMDGSYVREDVQPHVLNVLYGGQSSEHDFHKVGFTPALLEARLNKAGIKVNSIELKGYNIICNGTKLNTHKEVASRSLEAPTNEVPEVIKAAKMKPAVRTTTKPRPSKLVSEIAKSKPRKTKKRV